MMVSNKDAFSILTKQISENLLDVEGSRVRLSLIQSWWAHYDGYQIHISGDLDGAIEPNKPSWMEFWCDDTSFTLSMDSDGYIHEAAGLIYEVWKNSQEDPEVPLPTHLEYSLDALRRRWETPGDPIRDKEQRKYIGELQAVLEAYRIIGREAIEAWNPDGHALHDLSTDRWTIEAKATSSPNGSVRISNIDQLRYDEGSLLALSVTRLNADPEGITLPEYADSLLEEIARRGGEDMGLLRVTLMSLGINDAVRHLFRKKWDIGEIRFFEITEDSPIFPEGARELIPPEVRGIRYSLVTEGFEHAPLSEIFSGHGITSS